MINNKNNVKNIIEDMKKITILTREISNIHEQSLKKWPYIVFDNISSVEIKYSLHKDNFEESFVNFYLTSPQEDVDNIKKRGDTISSWVRHMFWEDINISVFYNEKELYSNFFNNPKELQTDI